MNISFRINIPIKVLVAQLTRCLIFQLLTNRRQWNRRWRQHGPVSFTRSQPQWWRRAPRRNSGTWGRDSAGKLSNLKKNSMPFNNCSCLKDSSFIQWSEVFHMPGVVVCTCFPRLRRHSTGPRVQSQAWVHIWEKGFDYISIIYLVFNIEFLIMLRYSPNILYSIHIYWIIFHQFQMHSWENKELKRKNQHFHLRQRFSTRMK